MEESKLKNMVRLKNLPSNIVEEAIIILKSNKKVKKLEKIEKNPNFGGSKFNKEEKDYVLKEAELLVSSYILKLEKNEKNSKDEKSKRDKDYSKLKKYAVLSSIVIFFQAIILILR